MRVNPQQFQINLLKKIRNQNLVETSKKRYLEQDDEHCISGKKTPIKIVVNEPQWDSSLKYSSELHKKLCVLKSFVIREDYYECVIEI